MEAEGSDTPDPATTMSPSSVPPAGNSPSDEVTMDWETIRTKLLGDDLTIALQAATELRERIEIVHTTEFPAMLMTLLPAFATVLSSGARPNPDTLSLGQQLRNLLLEIISRMPNNEVLRPYAPQILEIASDALIKDYEQNALLASQIMFNLHKNYRALPQDLVQPYLDFVLSVYSALPISVQRNFSFPEELSSGGQSTASLRETDLLESTATKETDKNLQVTPSRSELSTAPTPKTTSPSAGFPSTPIPRLAIKSGASFRVLAECPLTVMLLFQLYPRFIKSNISALINVMIEALELRPPPLQTPPGEKVQSEHKRAYFSRSRELVKAQVKTLSFLTHFLRGFGEQMKPYEDRIANNVVSLMKTCPRECISARRELLQATRHILATDFRKGLFRHVDALLDERILIGSHPRHSDQSVLRLLGYSALADLVHHSRSLLTMVQFSCVVHVFARVLHDSSLKLPMTIQITAVRLLLNIVDIIYHNKDPNPQLGRDLLVRILDTLVSKLGTVKDYIPVVEAGEAARKSNHEILKHRTDEGYAIDLVGLQAMAAISPDGVEQTLWSSELGPESGDSVRDLQAIIRSIVIGLKAVIWCINNYKHQREKGKVQDHVKLPSGSNDQVASANQKLTSWEREIIDRYIFHALPCIRVFKEKDEDINDCRNARVEGSCHRDIYEEDSSHSSDTLYREVLTYFAVAFTVLDGMNLRLTIGRHVEMLVEAVVDDRNVMVVPRHLLMSNQNASLAFCDVLLSFLVEKIGELSVGAYEGFLFLDSPSRTEMDDHTPRTPPEELFAKKRVKAAAGESTASTLLELFERVLKSLASFPENESVLRPHLQRIVSTCLRHTMESSGGWPDRCCTLLRYIFRSISAGKFEQSYKELLPLIPTILNGLYRIYCSTEDRSLRYAIVELCLTVPARLSSLLPHLPLLLRIIIPSLQSTKGDLVNLGLRTLEFWVDNLNPDYLYPILARQTNLLTELMTSLSDHLRPAPYPYGLLTLRLLGKLGGKNRRFLREEIDIASRPLSVDDDALLQITCMWSDGRQREDQTRGSSFSIPLPLARSVSVLKALALADNDASNASHFDSSRENPDGGTSSGEISWNDCERLLNLLPEDIDMASYCDGMVEETKREVSQASLDILRFALSEMVHVETHKSASGSSMALDVDTKLSGQDDSATEVAEGTKTGTVLEANEAPSLIRSEFVLRLCEGLVHASVLEATKDEATVLLRGLLSDCFLVITTLQRYILRIDSNGTELRQRFQRPTLSSAVEAEEKPASVPFGYFHMVGPFKGKADPFVVTRALAQSVCSPSKALTLIGLSAISQMSTFSTSAKSETNSTLQKGRDLFFESLLSELCRVSVDSPWNRRPGGWDAICLIIDENGKEWSRRFEREIYHVAVLAVKTAPREVPSASIEAFRFFHRVCTRLYGIPSSLNNGDIVYDSLSVDQDTPGATRVEKEETPPSGDKPGQAAQSLDLPSEAVLRLLVKELLSADSIVRFAARHAIQHFFGDGSSDMYTKLLASVLPSLKKLVFARSLRLLSLSEQVAAVEALAFFIHQAPTVLTVEDQHLLAFLSEFLKMASIADGDMTDSSLTGFVVDKNGYAMLAQQISSKKPNQVSYLGHTTAVFLRRECIVKCDSGNSFILIPEELAGGVQLRVSALRLFRCVVRSSSDVFFDSEPSTPIGNLRPHVVSLLFRSLISDSPKAVQAAYDALRDVLTLSAVQGETGSDEKPKSRLPKELLQTCIRPVLLKLRDYTRLSVPLLRGLARLLSLLSSWFNKSLGEKLLEHLQKWMDPEAILSKNIWREGYQPAVASAMIDLFSLLPHSSQFVEPLVRITVKLEVALHIYKPKKVDSPYRLPLARFLNKHCIHAVSFFFQRLRNPHYSSMFRSILDLESSSPLRTYLSGNQCSINLLNVCFERPLAIIRSEKTASSGLNQGAANPQSTVDHLTMHGISRDSTGAKRQKEATIRQGIEAKQEKLRLLQIELSRWKDLLQTRLTAHAASPTSESQNTVNKASARVHAIQGEQEQIQKDLVEIKSGDRPAAAPETSEKSDSPRPMTVDGLELQNQGFKVIEILCRHNSSYLKEHNDIVRAFRWLWRSKGRSLRLQNDESLPPRFHEESRLLGSLLVRYAEDSPKDVDILFELLRLFLLPTTGDYLFVRRFLRHTVSAVVTVEQKRLVMQRFFSLMAGDGPEETKILSIQLLVLPMLHSSFKQRKESNENKQPDNFVSGDMVEKFVSSVLFKKGTAISCGDRLRVELLRLSTLLVEYTPQEIHAYRKDVLRYSWSLLKSEDNTCMNWAYISVCRFISKFDTPAKIILQVYEALLRSHQQEWKDLVRTALGMLIPVLPERLGVEGFRQIVDCTKKIISEEGNAAPQLAHIWYTVVTHAKIFTPYRTDFIRQMVNSLNNLGLPPNCPSENRSLSVSVVELIILWSADQDHTTGPDELRAGKDDKIKRRRESPSVSGSKRLKSGNGRPVASAKDALSLDVGMIDTILNFLVRLRILLAHSKLDGLLSDMENRADGVLKVVMRRWPKGEIRGVHFAKLVSMCADESSKYELRDAYVDIRAREKGKSRGSKASKTGKGVTGRGSGGSSSGQQDDRSVSAHLLAACLDIFNALLEECRPVNSFLYENSDKVTTILGSCFSRVRQRGCGVIRRKLKEFTVGVLTSQELPLLDHKGVIKLRFQLESLILEGIASDVVTYGSSTSEGTDGFRGFPSDEGKAGGSCVAYFSVDVISKVIEKKPDFVESFTGSLVSLTTKLCSRHVEDSSATHRQVSQSAHQLGVSAFDEKSFTPVAGILAHVCVSSSDSTSSASRQPNADAVKVTQLGTALMSLTLSIRLLAGSCVPFKFTVARKSLLQTLGTILEKSDNVQLLMSSVAIVGRWLLMQNGHGPLTRTERIGFLSKLASLDFNSRSDAASQPLVDLVTCFMLTLHEKGHPLSNVGETSLIQAGRLYSKESEEMMLSRVLSSCLLTPNVLLRNRVLKHYVLPAASSSRQVDDTWKAAGNSPFEALWELCHCDFEGLGGRLWGAVFVEVLLARCKVYGKPPVTADRGWLCGPTLVSSPADQSGLIENYFHFRRLLVDEHMWNEAHTGRAVSAIAMLASVDFRVCQGVLECLMRAAWEETSTDAMRLSLTSAFESLLARPYHSQIIDCSSLPLETHSRAIRSKRDVSNAVKSFLMAISKLSPLPFLDINLMVSLADVYNTWHEVLDILEKQFFILSSNELSAKGQEMEKALFAAIRRCYEQLGESRIALSLSSSSCRLPETKHAISLDVHGLVNEALFAYSDLMKRMEKDDCIDDPLDSEMDLWESRWIDLQKELCQLQVVSEYFSGSGNPLLQLDSSWKLQNWTLLRSLCCSPSLTEAVERGDPTLKMIEILLAINEGKLSEVENLHAQTAQLSLNRWQLLPALSTGSLAHSELLHFFHRLVELRESGQIMVETSNHSSRKTLPDLKNLLAAWRHRLPNDFDALADWDSVVLWRMHMFSAITSNFCWSEPGTLATLHDKPWTSVRMAKAARKQGLPEVALLSLNKLSDGAMEVADAFSKLREQILAHDSDGSELQRTGGLNLVNNTNLSFFDQTQKGELFRLKGTFLASLGARSKANDAFRNAVQLCPTQAKAWASWGNLCSSLGVLTEKQIQQQGAKADIDTGSETSLSKKVATYLAQAMGCYIEAIQCDASEFARMYLPKCLCMLIKDGSAPGILCQTLETRASTLPPWVWLPWIPQLLSSLCRTEGRAVKAVLSAAIKAYPQAVYFPLRAFYLERRDVERSRGASSSVSHHHGSVLFAEELMSVLRRTHATLWSSLEAIVEELIGRFRPSFEEELLAYITALLERAETQGDIFAHPTRKAEDERALVESVSKTLVRISKKFFCPPSSESVPSKNDDRTKKAAEFRRKYMDRFNADFQVGMKDSEQKSEANSRRDDSEGRETGAQTTPQSPGTSDVKPGPNTQVNGPSLAADGEGTSPILSLDIYVARLRKWKALLETQVALTPSSVPLVECSISMATFASKAPDLWPGSCDPRHACRSSSELENPYSGEDSLGPPSTTSSAVAARDAAEAAARTVAKIAALDGCGGEYGGGSSAIEVPGQYAPNTISANDARPCPELHTKLVRFDGVVQVVRRSEQLVRRIGMLGNDGTKRYFLLQFAIPYWTRTDERTAQLQFIFDKLLRYETMSARNLLSLQPTPVVPIAQRLRMVAEEKTWTSLDRVRQDFCERRGIDPGSPTEYFQRTTANCARGQKLEELDEPGRLRLEQSSKLEALRGVRSATTDPTMLFNYVSARLEGVEELFHFRRQFAGQLAAESLLQFVFCVVERTPSRFSFVLNRGKALTPDYRFEYNNQGFLEPRKVPFRMTPNVENLLGPILLEGRFITSMATVAGALQVYRDDLDPVLRLLMRDDIVAWYTSKSMAKSDAKTRDLERQLADRVARNVVDAQRRISDCAPKSQEKGDDATQICVDAKVRRLVEEASSPENLCMMPINFQAWL